MTTRAPAVLKIKIPQSFNISFQIQHLWLTMMGRISSSVESLPVTCGKNICLVIGAANFFAVRAANSIWRLKTLSTHICIVELKENRYKSLLVNVVGRHGCGVLFCRLMECFASNV